MNKSKCKVEDRMFQADMTPMIDCIFQLLIFFMCSIHFRELEGKLQSWLPSTSGPDIRAIDVIPNEIRVKIQYDQVMRKISYFVADMKVNTIDELVTELKWGIDKTKQAGGLAPSIKLAPEKNVPFQPVVDVLNGCKYAEIGKIEFAALH
ncbi:MAG: biopolymer transporter ExbD [Planctomycetes bacterium]|nr:biopolymer transporter ExbD [Planctomycetota bacterium]